jgi:hypothetical protein
MQTIHRLDVPLGFIRRDDDDYDIDFYTAAPITAPDPSDDAQKLASNREHLEVCERSLLTETHRS